MATDGQDDLVRADDSMISNNSPYQPTTEPVSNRPTECLGMIVDTMYLKSIGGILKFCQVVFCIVILIYIGAVFRDSFNAAIAPILFVVSSSVFASQAKEAADKAAIAFGFIAALFYGVSAWIAYRSFVVDRHKRRGNVAHVQGVQDSS